MNWLKIGLVVALLLIPVSAKAEIEKKIGVGYAHILCDGIGSSPVVSLSVEGKKSFLGLECGIEVLSPQYYSVGQGISGDLFLTGKAYWNDFYIGLGGGYVLNGMLWDEYPDNLSNVPKSDIDNEFERHLVVGKNFKNDWFAEIKRVQTDLDIETGIIDFEPQIEKRSRLDRWVLKIGKRF